MGSEALNQKFLYIPKIAWIASAILHGSVVFLFLAAQILDHFGIHLFNKPMIDTREMYQDYIQVDVVALPDQMFGEKTDTTLEVVEKPAAIVEPPAPEVEAAPPVEEADAMAEQIAAETEKKALQEKAKKEADAATKAKAEKQKAEQEKALKRLEAEASRDAAMKALAAAGKKGRAQLKGNKVSQGTGTTGKIGTPSDRWGSLLGQRIKENFTVFQRQNKKLQIVVFIRVFPNGRLREKRIVKPSPDAAFNAAALRAIDASQPLPVPDDPSLFDEGINLIMTPEE